jgi:hypothetical protein
MALVDAAKQPQHMILSIVGKHNLQAAAGVGQQQEQRCATAVMGPSCGTARACRECLNPPALWLWVARCPWPDAAVHLGLPGSGGSLA